MILAARAVLASGARNHARFFAQSQAVARAANGLTIRARDDGRIAMSFEAAVHRKAIEIGKLSVEMTTAAGSGHPSTALSLAHLVTVLMYHQMRWDPKDPWNPAADRLVLSEGHAVPIIYAALADLGGDDRPARQGRATRPGR